MSDPSPATALCIDDRTVDAPVGTTLLKACLDAEIYIPNLCYMERLDHPDASCRMCFVEIDGEDKPVASCTVRVREKMAVRTDTPAVRRLQRSALKLLLSTHLVECRQCPANRRCELQKIGRFLGVGLRPGNPEGFLKEPSVVEDHPHLLYHPNRCVLCGKCIHACRAEHGKPAVSFIRRGLSTTLGLYGGTEEAGTCASCNACVQICPVGALSRKINSDCTTRKISSCAVRISDTDGHG